MSRVHSSPGLDQAVAAKVDGCRKELKTVATEYVVCKDQYSFIEGMNKAALIASKQGQDFPEILVATINQGLLIFQMPEAEAIAKVLALQPRVTKPVPAKVLAKMVSLRMTKITDHIQGMNKAIGVNPQYYPGQSPIVILDEVNSVAELNTFCNMITQGKHAYSIETRLVNELKTFFERPDWQDPRHNQDSMVKDGWNMIITKAVMES